MASVENALSVPTSSNGVDKPSSEDIAQKLTKRDKLKLRLENEKKLKIFTDRITEKSESFLSKVMPVKIVQITKLVEGFGDFESSVMDVSKSVVLPPNPQSPAQRADGEPNAKKRKLNASAAKNITAAQCVDTVRRWARNAERSAEQTRLMSVHVPSNERVVAVLKPLKIEAYELIEMVSVMKLWIQLNIPRIEDGNNFGVGVQEEIVGELCGTEDASFMIIEHITKYFTSRAKLVSKVVKWPCVVDYRSAVNELDQREYAQLRIDCVDLRNHYLTLYDMINKNIEKLQRPRSHLALQSMY